MGERKQDLPVQPQEVARDNADYAISKLDHLLASFVYQTNSEFSSYHITHVCVCVYMHTISLFPQIIQNLC